MKRDDQIQSYAARMTDSFRRTGWLFLIVGSIVCIHPIAILFNPEAAIPVNGVPIKDFGTKLGVAAFALIFPLLGAFFALTPKKTMEHWMTNLGRWASHFFHGRQ